MNTLPQPEVILGIGLGLVSIGLIFVFWAHRNQRALVKAHSAGALIEAKARSNRAAWVGRFLVAAGLVAAIIGVAKVI
jgi:hypothetical protein